MKRPIIQIAGISSLKEALMVAAAGATHLGFPFRLDFHREDCSPSDAARIISKLPKGVQAVLITYLSTAEEIAELMKLLSCNIVQLHGDISMQEILHLRKIVANVEIWKSLIVNPINSDFTLQLLKKFEPLVDAFITDTFDPETGASGATGKTHDWNVSRKITDESRKPVIVAGGLNPQNVFECIKFTRPAGVDVHTGVEGEDGLKRQDLAEAFVKHALKAFQEIDQE
ncbi:MAG: phosphoribosylanthranilate isomerase [Bacteroidales bacterium]|nr:phosphoribosylanthranilate isomerase [Bacteroidales bacterium]